METLFAPWRMEYILGEKEGGCVFCNRIARRTYEEDLIVARTPFSFAILNRYPYNNGHLLVVPIRHVPDLPRLPDEEYRDLTSLLRVGIEVLAEALSPAGMNVGANIGEVAGAGVAQHVHFHVVPRWMGDTSYMTVLSAVRVIPQHLIETYRLLLPVFAARGLAPKDGEPASAG
jgi:ATP adenylyltransferase